jgi:hypothetical protein
MIELTDEQIQSLCEPSDTPPRAVNPKTSETFVLLRVEEYERLKAAEGDEVDDSPWTREERNAILWERAVREGWEDDDEPASEKP